VDKNAYTAIRRQLDHKPRWAPTITMVAFATLLFCVALAGLRAGSLGGYVLAQLCLPVVAFNAFALLHECGHGSATPSKTANSVLGLITSLFCFIPYFPWKYIHQKHHAWSGHIDNDPVLASAQKFRREGVPALVALCWRRWIPLAALLQHFVYALYPLKLLRQGALKGRRLYLCGLSIAFIPLGWGLIFLVAPEPFRVTNVAPALLLFLILEELVNVPHHVAMPLFERKLPLWEQHLTTRSCHYPRGLSELLVLNFNYHIEHHLYPALPWYRLRKARRLLKPALQSAYTECLGIAWNLENRSIALSDLLGSRSQKEQP